MKNLFSLLIYLFLFLTSSITSKQLKIAIIGAHDENYESIGRYAHLNKQKYAKKNGYDVFLYNKNLTDREPYWSKIIAILNHLDDYDWLFWLDSDALIMNEQIKLEDLIDDNFDFITTRDCGGTTNSGQFLIKNSQWSKDFLNKWYSLGNLPIPPGLDNGALIQLCKDIRMHQGVNDKEHIKIIPQRMLSSFIGLYFVRFNFDGEYKERDFIIHFAGISHDKKAKFMKEYYEKT